MHNRIKFQCTSVTQDMLLIDRKRDDQAGMSVKEEMAALKVENRSLKRQNENLLQEVTTLQSKLAKLEPPNKVQYILILAT